MLPARDYHMSVAVKDFKTYFGHDYTGEGWYTNSGDWLLVTQRTKTQLDIEVWNGHDPRKDIMKVISLPNRVDAPLPVL